MNDRSTKPKPVMAVKDKGRPQSGEYARTANVDDEFHEFFNQGDIGEYEGGVAYSRPPSQLLPEFDEPIVDEQIVIADPSRQKARRAFFGRVVAIIVAACVLLLFTAARFKPQDVRKDTDNDTRNASALNAESPGLKLSTPVEVPPQAQALPVVPAVAAAAALPPAPAAVAAPPPSAEVQPQAPAPIGKAPAAKVAEAIKTPDSSNTAAREQPKQAAAPTTPAAKVSSGLGSPAQLAKKSKALATREAPPPAAGASKPVKESVGAFPVD